MICTQAQSQTASAGLSLMGAPPLALAVPLSRFTPRVGGGSACYVRRHYLFARYGHSSRDTASDSREPPPDSSHHRLHLRHCRCHCESMASFFRGTQRFWLVVIVDARSQRGCYDYFDGWYLVDAPLGCLYLCRALHRRSDCVADYSWYRDLEGSLVAMPCDRFVICVFQEDEMTMTFSFTFVVRQKG